MYIYLMLIPRSNPSLVATRALLKKVIYII